MPYRLLRMIMKLVVAQRILNLRKRKALRSSLEKLKIDCFLAFTIQRLSVCLMKRLHNIDDVITSWHVDIVFGRRKKIDGSFLFIYCTAKQLEQY